MHAGPILRAASSRPRASPDHTAKLPFLSPSNFGLSNGPPRQYGTSLPSYLRCRRFLLPSICRIKNLSPFSIWSLSQPGLLGFYLTSYSLKLTAIAAAWEENRATSFVFLDQLTQSFSKGHEFNYTKCSYTQEMKNPGSPACGPPCMPRVPSATLRIGGDHKFEAS